MRGGRREGAGRKPGSGAGPTVEVRSVSMIPQAWQLLDEMRGASSRGVWIASAVFRAHNGHAAALSKASLTPQTLRAECPPTRAYFMLLRVER